MYKPRYHHCDLSGFSFLITGGAGFIGSNIVEYLVRHGAGFIRILDDLSNGYYANIESFVHLPNVEFIHGDIRDFETCKEAVHGMDFVSHQAALGSVPRSVKNPILSNSVNITGFLNILVAAREADSVKRFVYAASSSTYGDHQELPKVEGREGKPISPYGVTKAVNEMYADVFSRLYGFHTIGLRYFNMFGPKQSPDNPYAAVIPLFCNHFINGTVPTINGDGETTRDFTFVANAVQANMKAMLFGIDRSGKQHRHALSRHEVFNVACGDQISLNTLVHILCEISGKNIVPVYGPERPGDVKHSKADIQKIQKLLGYRPDYFFKQGLTLTYAQYQKEMSPVHHNAEEF